MVTRFLFYYPHLLSFFRQRNLRAFFCLRCLHQIQIHCKSVCNLRPPHAPVIAIFSLSFTIITMFSRPLSLLPRKKTKQKPKPKKRNDIFILMDTQTERHLFHAVRFDRGGCNWLCTINQHDSWNVTCPLPRPSSPAPWTLLSPLFVQDSRKISSNGKHHHKLLSSLDNKERGILYLNSKCVTDVHLKFP